MIYAKCIDDWGFVDKEGKTIGNTLTVDPSTIAASDNTFRFQKNPRLHGTRIEFLSTPKDAEFCPTLTKIRILKRYQRLGMLVEDPLAVYRKYKDRKIDTHFLKAGVETTQQTTHVNDFI